MEQFTKLMIRCPTCGYPLGLELTMRIISQIYLPVLIELNRGNKLELPLFTQIIKGALQL